jgi:hypothetical protein
LLGSWQFDHPAVRLSRAQTLVDMARGLVSDFDRQPTVARKLPPLGVVQRGFLDAVNQHGGYVEGGGWIWKGRVASRAMAKGLVKRGLLYEEEVRASLLPGGYPYDRIFYRITEAGKKEVAK